MAVIVLVVFPFIVREILVGRNYFPNAPEFVNIALYFIYVPLDFFEFIFLNYFVYVGIILIVILLAILIFKRIRKK